MGHWFQVVHEWETWDSYKFSCQSIRAKLGQEPRSAEYVLDRKNSQTLPTWFSCHSNVSIYDEAKRIFKHFKEVFYTIHVPLRYVAMCMFSINPNPSYNPLQPYSNVMRFHKRSLLWLIILPDPPSNPVLNW